MTGRDLVGHMAKATGWPKAGSERALRAMLAAIRTSLKRGDSVTLVGFGTFPVAGHRLGGQAACGHDAESERRPDRLRGRPHRALQAIEGAQAGRPLTGFLLVPGDGRSLQ